jgi:hypothetical protein
MRRRAVAALVVAVAAGAGCGTSEEEEFRTERLAPLEARIDRHRAQITAVLQDTQAKDARDAALLEERIADLEREVSDAATVEAPGSVSDGYARHVRALRTLVRDLRGLASALERGGGATLEQAGQRAAGAADAVVRTRQTLESELARAE